MDGNAPVNRNDARCEKPFRELAAARLALVAQFSKHVVSWTTLPGTNRVFREGAGFGPAPYPSPRNLVPRLQPGNQDRLGCAPPLHVRSGSKETVLSEIMRLLLSYRFVIQSLT